MGTLSKRLAFFLIICSVSVLVVISISFCRLGIPSITKFKASDDILPQSTINDVPIQEKITMLSTAELIPKACVLAQTPGNSTSVPRMLNNPKTLCSIPVALLVFLYFKILRRRNVVYHRKSSGIFSVVLQRVIVNSVLIGLFIYLFLFLFLSHKKRAILTNDWRIEDPVLPASTYKIVYQELLERIEAYKRTPDYTELIEQKNGTFVSWDKILRSLEFLYTRIIELCSITEPFFDIHYQPDESKLKILYLSFFFTEYLSDFVFNYLMSLKIPIYSENSFISCPFVNSAKNHLNILFRHYNISEYSHLRKKIIVSKEINQFLFNRSSDILSIQTLTNTTFLTYGDSSSATNTEAMLRTYSDDLKLVHGMTSDAIDEYSRNEPDLGRIKAIYQEKNFKEAMRRLSHWKVATEKWAFSILSGPSFLQYYIDEVNGMFLMMQKNK